ncbi:hypothetical protein CSUNSWCD_686 [Campylobacter showae CSUNSWCD]|uniref:Uncharacterized protein n=1 Tax=Campylobacter showae CSUNSWCD TaxID=1244083 RepID=M5IE10_9BACT|nr:hypothetical protein CSUNSWCD_686 [Campylobacter showae CSUNSWCD]
MLSDTVENIFGKAAIVKPIMTMATMSSSKEKPFFIFTTLVSCLVY